jgi:hypothetical protein
MKAVQREGNATKPPTPWLAAVVEATTRWEITAFYSEKLEEAKKIL